MVNSQNIDVHVNIASVVDFHLSSYSKAMKSDAFNFPSTNSCAIIGYVAIYQNTYI